LYFLPDPQGHGALRDGPLPVTVVVLADSASCSACSLSSVGA
jgi:hypothetical protein